MTGADGRRGRAEDEERMEAMRFVMISDTVFAMYFVTALTLKLQRSVGVRGCTAPMARRGQSALCRRGRCGGLDIGVQG